VEEQGSGEEGLTPRYSPSIGVECGGRVLRVVVLWCCSCRVVCVVCCSCCVIVCVTCFSSYRAGAAAAEERVEEEEGGGEGEPEPLALRIQRLLSQSSEEVVSPST